MRWDVSGLAGQTKRVQGWVPRGACVVGAGSVRWGPLRSGCGGGDCAATVDDERRTGPAGDGRPRDGRRVRRLWSFRERRDVARRAPARSVHMVHTALICVTRTALSAPGGYGCRVQRRVTTVDGAPHDGVNWTARRPSRRPLRSAWSGASGAKIARHAFS